MVLDTHMFALATAAFSAGLAIGHPWLALFLTFCAACAVDVKTQVFLTAVAMAVAGSGIVLVVPNARYGALPLAVIAFAVRSGGKMPRTASVVPPQRTAISPSVSIASLL